MLYLSCIGLPKAIFFNYTLKPRYYYRGFFYICVSKVVKTLKLFLFHSNFLPHFN